MANKLSYNDLLKYMKIVLEMEKNIYIQQQTLNQLRKKADSLGFPKQYDVPIKNEKITYKSFEIFDEEGGGTLAFALFFVLPLFVDMILWNTLFQNFSTLGKIALSAIIFFILSFVPAFFLDLKDKIDSKKRNEEEYQQKMNEYNLNVSNDKKRVENELEQKAYLLSQCDILESIRQESQKNLNIIYSYDVLAEKYRNLVAVSSIYEYLEYEMTRSLQRQGNDEGAYNIYEINMRLDRIITNTDIIIQKLDEIIANQRMLAGIMYSAIDSINHLVTSTNDMAARIESGMNQLNASAELSNYQQQQTNNELRYMNLMNTLHFY